MTNIEKSIIKEFDEQCCDIYPGDSGLGGNDPQEPRDEITCFPEDVRKFILSALAKQRAEIVKEIEFKIESIKKGRIECDCLCLGPFCSNLIHPCDKPTIHYTQRDQMLVDFYEEIKASLTSSPSTPGTEEGETECSCPCHCFSSDSLCKDENHDGIDCNHCLPGKKGDTT